MILSLLLASFASCKISYRRLAEYDYNKDGRWFYAQLTKYQQPFYDALEYWRINNLLTGAPSMYLDSDEHLNVKVDQSIIKLYISGKSSALNTQFLSAVAAWRFDHPEIFYLDVSKIMFRLSQDEKGNFKILFGCLSHQSLLEDFIQPNEVKEMISQFNTEVTNMVNAAKDLKTTTEKVKAIHNYLKESITYSRPYQISEDQASKRNYVYSSYGALINHICVCDGFSQAFQIAMNELNIPAVRVPGDALDSNGQAQSHSWNVVQLDDKEWYLVDVTYDTTGKTENWLLISQADTYETHFPNGQLDSNPVTFYFPPAPLPGQNSWSFDYEYTEDGTLYSVIFSYKGKNSTGLLDDNYRYVYRTYRFNKNLGVFSGDIWVDLRRFFMGSTGEEGADKNLTYAHIFPDKSVTHIQFGLVYNNVTFIPANELEDSPDKYSGVNSSDVLFVTQLIATYNNITNLTMFQGMEEPKVQYYSPTPRHFFPGYEYSFIFTMSEDLTSNVTEDADKTYSNFSITLTAKSNNIYDRENGRAEIIGEEAVKMTTLSNVQIINENTFAAVIKPSSSYAHDYMDYTVHFNGLKGYYSQKPVQPFTFLVRFFPNNGGTNICSKMMGEGTIYVAGRPVLITDGDIRNNGQNDNFTAVAENGTEVSGRGSTSSDIALVATREDEGTYEKYTATFDISLSLYCRAFFIVPGKFNCPLTIQLPFPEGFDPEKNKDVTFEVIHYLDNGVEEHNTVVVGPTGLLITVQSFSPFKIKPKSSSAVALESNEYPLFTIAKGGSPNIILKTDNGDKKITNLVTTYKLNQEITIELLSNSSRIERIFLNGKAFPVDSYKNFTLPQSFLNQQSNSLEVYLVKKEVLDMEYEKQFSPCHVTVDIAASTQKEENRQLNEALSRTAGPPILAGGDEINNPPNGIISGTDEDKEEVSVPDVDLNELPKFEKVEKPPEDPYQPYGLNVVPPKKKLSKAGIIGIVVAVVVVIVVVILLVYFLVIRPKKLHQNSEKGEDDVQTVKPNDNSDGL